MIAELFCASGARMSGIAGKGKKFQSKKWKLWLKFGGSGAVIPRKKIGSSDAMN